MRIFATMIALSSLCGCAGLSTLGSYSSVAPKFENRSVHEMVEFFGAPVGVSGSDVLQLYEWRIGKYVSEPAEIDGHVSRGGDLSGTVQGGGTMFLGCIIRATADSGGIVTTVSLDSRTNHVGSVQNWVGCNASVRDPFLEAAAAEQKILDQSSNIAVGTTTDEVISIMGPPTEQFLVTDRLEEWHYCATGRSADNFVILYFDQGQLVRQETYVVTLKDTGGVTGHCSQFVRQGSYQQSQGDRGE